MKKFIKLFYNHANAKYLLHIILFKFKALNQLGFLATGESYKNSINPFFITCDATESDIHLIFDDNFSFPFLDNQIKLIYSSHNLEHLNTSTSKRYFDEAHRVLKVGGELSIEVPNAELIYFKYGKFLESGSLDALEELLNFEFDEEVLNNVINNQNLTSNEALEALNGVHNKVLSFLSCYCVPDYVGAHTPVVVQKEIFNSKYSALSMEEFFEWCIDLMNEDQKKSGGHINPWYPKKLIQQLEKHEFDVKIRSYKESRIFSTRWSQFFIPDREHRSFYSFRISAIKR